MKNIFFFFTLVNVIENLYCTVGCHPTRCNEFDEAKTPETYFNSLTDVINSNRAKVVAIGECGLDNQRLHFCPKETQEKYDVLQ